MKTKREKGMCLFFSYAKDLDSEFFSVFVTLFWGYLMCYLCKLLCAVILLQFVLGLFVSDLSVCMTLHHLCSKSDLWSSFTDSHCSSPLLQSSLSYNNSCPGSYYLDPYNFTSKMLLVLNFNHNCVYIYIYIYIFFFFSLKKDQQSVTLR